MLDLGPTELCAGIESHPDVGGTGTLCAGIGSPPDVSGTETLKGE